MHGRHALGLLVAAVLSAAALAPDRAAAYHEDDEQLVTDTAHTLGEQGEMRLGLWRYDIGVFDRLDVGTYTWLYLVPFPNLQLKWRIWSDGRWALALKTGLYFLPIGWIYWTDLESDATVGIFPFELWLTIPIEDDWGLHVGSASTTTFVSGSYDPDEFEGAAAHSNQQIILSGEWRATRVTKLLLTFRFLIAERIRGNARFERQLDDFTTVEIVGAAQLQGEELRRAGSLMLSSAFSWETFNFRIGVGFGNYNLPSINVMIPVRTLIAELDLYWRW